MSKKFLLLSGILLTIIVGTIFFRLHCCNCGGNLTKEADKAGSPVVMPENKIKDVNTPSSDSAAMNTWQAIKEKLNSNPLVLYFGINKSDVSLTNDEKMKIDEILNYLKKFPDAGLSVTGYTDNSGDRNDNIRLGQSRADFVKAQLVLKGIPENKITSESKGPDDPAAENNSPEGKAKNRRVVILFK